MAGRMKRDPDAVDLDPLAPLGHLPLGREILAIAQSHDIERAPGRKHMAVAGPRMIGVAMRDQGAVHRLHGVDEEVSRRAVEPLRDGTQQVFETGHAV